MPDTPPSRRISLKLRRDAAGAIQVAGAPDTSPDVARVAAVLDQVTRLASAPEARPVDVQPVVQVSDPAPYRRWRSDREAIWRAQRAPYTTAGWPAKLAPGLVAGVLLPLPYGATAGGGRKAPRLVAAPLFSTRPRTDGFPEDIALGLIGEWLRLAATSGPPMRVAAPILEIGSDRRAFDLGLEWPLAAVARG
jgi:hypothetical protein